MASTTKALAQGYTGAPLSSGDRIEYTLTLTNSGDATASNLVVQGLVPTNTTYASGTLTVDGVSIAGDLTTSSVLNLNSIASGASTVIVLSVDIDAGLPADASWITSEVITDYDESSDSVVSDNDTTGHCGITDDGYDHAQDAGVYTNDDDPTKLPLLQATHSRPASSPLRT